MSLCDDNASMYMHWLLGVCLLFSICRRRFVVPLQDSALVEGDGHRCFSWWVSHLCCVPQQNLEPSCHDIVGVAHEPVNEAATTWPNILSHRVLECLAARCPILTRRCCAPVGSYDWSDKDLIVLRPFFFFSNRPLRRHCYDEAFVVTSLCFFSLLFPHSDQQNKTKTTPMRGGYSSSTS